MIRDCEKFEMSLSLSEEDSYLKFKAQVNFLKETGLGALKLTSTPDVASMFDRGLTTILQFVDNI